MRVVAVECLLAEQAAAEKQLAGLPSVRVYTARHDTRLDTKSPQRHGVLWPALRSVERGAGPTTRHVNRKAERPRILSTYSLTRGS